jgi:hypothetical protein
MEYRAYNQALSRPRDKLDSTDTSIARDIVLHYQRMTINKLQSDPLSALSCRAIAKSS